MAFSNHKVQITVTARDLATQTLRGVESAVGRMNRNFGSVGNFFGNFSKGLDSTINKMDRLANSLYRFNMYTSNIQRNLRNIGTIGTLATGAVAYQGLSSTLGFDHSTHVMQSRMQVSHDVRKDIEKYILDDLNTKVSFTPKQIADMGIVFGQGGINDANEMKKLMATTTYFSEAVNAVPEQAAEMIIAAAKGFKISMEDSMTISDKLTTAVNNSLLHVEELPHALGQLSGRAAMFGQSLDSSLVMLMATRDQGLSAAQASQNMLAGFRQISYIGNEMTLFKRRRRYYEELGIDTSFFDMEKKQLKEYPLIIESLEKTMFNNKFINNKYKDLAKNYEDFSKLRDAGELPDDYWDKKKAMPLISRTFGAAGMTPMMMGLQTKYEVVDPETGTKTGETYYGSAALKKMQELVENSSGKTKETHEIIEDSGQFQLEVLKGAWEASQIKFLDSSLPLIKTISKELTNWLVPKKDEEIHDPNKPRILQDTEAKPKSALDRVDESIEKVAENFREKGNYRTADFIEHAGKFTTGGIRIGSTMPTMFDQFGDAFKANVIDAEWGSNIIEFPWHIVKNGINFITDLLKANEEFNDLVSKLPGELQDPAKLIETLSKAGVIMLVTGAIVKVIELGVRGVSTVLKTGKLAMDLSLAVYELIKKALGLGGDGKNSPGGLMDDLSKNNKNIRANIVNVYGDKINSKGGKGKGKGGTVILGKDGKPIDKDKNKNKSGRKGTVILGKDGKPISSDKGGSNQTKSGKKGRRGGGIFGDLGDILPFAWNPYVLAGYTGWKIGDAGAEYIAQDYKNKGPMYQFTGRISPYATDVKIENERKMKEKAKKSISKKPAEIKAYTPKTPIRTNVGYRPGATPYAPAQNIKKEVLREAQNHTTREIGTTSKKLSSNFNNRLNTSIGEVKSNVSKQQSKTNKTVDTVVRLNKDTSQGLGSLRTNFLGFSKQATANIGSNTEKVGKMSGRVASAFDRINRYKTETTGFFGKLNNGLNNHKTDTANAVSSITESLKSTDNKVDNVSSSIVEGFSVANERLQNVKVDNQVNVNVPPANITVTGNIKPHVSVTQTRPSTQVRKPSTNRLDLINQFNRRFGWR